MFQPGHKLAPGGKREGAGRKSNKELEAAEIIRERIRQRFLKDADYFYDNYRRFANETPRTAEHAIDRLMPNEQITIPTSQTINFIQFNNNPPPIEHVEISPSQQNGEVLIEAAGFVNLSNDNKRKL